MLYAPHIEGDGKVPSPIRCRLLSLGACVQDDCARADGCPRSCRAVGLRRFSSVTFASVRYASREGIPRIILFSLEVVIQAHYIPRER